MPATRVFRAIALVAFSLVVTLALPALAGTGSHHQLASEHTSP
jgi:hypothetical protein